MKVTQELTKLYYSIGEIATLFGVSNSLIRYWETEFPQLKPQKNKRGDRKYIVKDIRTLEVIYTLVKEKGYTIDGANKAVKTELIASKKKEEAVQKLVKIRASLHAIKEKLG